MQITTNCFLDSLFYKVKKLIVRLDNFSVHAYVYETGGGGGGGRQGGTVTPPKKKMSGILGACMYPFANTGIEDKIFATRAKHVKNVCAPKTEQVLYAYEYMYDVIKLNVVNDILKLNLATGFTVS